MHRSSLEAANVCGSLVACLLPLSPTLVVWPDDLIHSGWATHLHPAPRAEPLEFHRSLEEVIRVFQTKKHPRLACVLEADPPPPPDVGTMPPTRRATAISTLAFGARPPVPDISASVDDVVGWIASLGLTRYAGACVEHVSEVWLYKEGCGDMPECDAAFLSWSRLFLPWLTRSRARRRVLQVRD